MKIRQDLETLEQAVEKARRQLTISRLNSKNLERQVPVSKRGLENLEEKRTRQDSKRASS
jgi:hypothetical protein